MLGIIAGWHLLHLCRDLQQQAFISLVNQVCIALLLHSKHFRVISLSGKQILDGGRQSTIRYMNRKTFSSTKCFKDNKIRLCDKDCGCQLLDCVVKEGLSEAVTFELQSELSSEVPCNLHILRLQSLRYFKRSKFSTYLPFPCLTRETSEGKFSKCNSNSMETNGTQLLQRLQTSTYMILSVYIVEPVEQKQAKQDYQDKRNQCKEYKECMG